MSHGQKLTIPEQIVHMKQRGITFDIMNEVEATQYLERNNNYFKLRAYRKNYMQNGKGEYVGLDFAYLRDIAIIDMRLRYVLLKMCLDIEHAARVKLITAVVDSPNEDGYSIVSDFKDANERFYQETIGRASRSIYCADLQAKYRDQMPIWALVEMMQFSALCEFYRFAARRLDRKDMQKEFYLLQETRQLRNACAHSNCILNDLKSIPTATHMSDSGMTKALSEIETVSRDVRKRKMSNDRIRQITSLLYLFTKFVKSDGLIKHRGRDLREIVFDRYNKHSDFYVKAEPISTTFQFFQRVLDKWYPDVVI